MDLVGKSLVKNQVSSLTKTIGLSGDENKDEEQYDQQKALEQDERAAKEKAKRQEAQLKKKADRAAERNKVREKYGLKESKTDQKLLESRDELEKTSPSQNPEKGKGKDDSNCAVM